MIQRTLRGLSLLPFLLALVVAQPARADDIALNAIASSDWQLSSNERSCWIEREFTAENERFLLRFRSAPYSTVPTEILSSITLRPDQPEISYLPERRMPSLTDVRFGHAGDMEAILFSATLEMPSAKGNSPVTSVASRPEVGVITGIEVNGTFDQDFRIETGSLATPIAALEACSREIFREMGLNLEEFDRIAKFPFRENFDLVARRMMRNNPGDKVATFEVIVVIDTAGKVTACQPSRREVDTRYSDVACDIMLNHARYTPAEDAEGIAVNSLDMLSGVFSPN